MRRTAYNQGGTHTEQLPRLRSYAEALQYHNNVVPLRSGNCKDQRPLGRVRRFTRSIIRLEGGVNSAVGVSFATPDVVLSYYQNDVIRFKADNTVHLSTCGWSSLSTMQFLNDILGGGSNFVRKKGKIYYKAEGNYHLLQHAKPAAPDCTDYTDCVPHMVIDLNTGEVSGGGSIDTHTLNKAEMHKVRKDYREFLQYAHDCLAMSVAVPLPASAPDNNVYKQIPYIRVTNRAMAPLTYRSPMHVNNNPEPTQRAMREAILSVVNSNNDTYATGEAKLEAYYEAFKTICLTTIHYLPFSYRYSRGADTEFKCHRDYFDSLFTGMLKLHYADRLFQKTTFASPMARIPSEKNNFYPKCTNL